MARESKQEELEPVLDCTDEGDCQCPECESARVCNLRVALIRCVRDGEMNLKMRQEAIAVVTHTYGTDKWLEGWNINPDEGE